MKSHSLWLTYLLLSGPAVAQLQGDLLLGTPAQSQNVSIQHIDGHLGKEWLAISSLPCTLGTAGRLGLLEVDHESALRLGGEVRFTCPVAPHWQIALPLGIVWLSDHQFGQPGRRKDYGGPWQFVAAINVGYAITARWSLGYEFSHMSNWDFYDPNPTLNSHNLLLSYRF